eukprot:1351594-Alexandrium_andersonii.AAC.1
MGRDPFWQLGYADDLNSTAAGPLKFDLLVLKLLMWAALGTPFSWAKLHGGLAVESIGSAT